MAARSIALIGLSGAGKSTVAGLIAAELGSQSYDSDRELERATGRTIPDIFDKDGEPRFREIEAETLARLAHEPAAVIATGGGAPTSPGGRAALEGMFVAWLRLTPETAASRLLANPATEERPLARGDVLANLRNMLERRAAVYEAAADAIIDVDALTPAEVASAVVDAYRAAHDRKATRMTADKESLQPAAQVTTPGASYGIYVERGAIASLGTICRDAGLKGRAFVISDLVIGPVFGQQCVDALTGAGYPSTMKTIDGGEANKHLGTAALLWDWLLGQRVERSDFVVCVGGGVITDTAGFVAATTLRGLPFVHVPTTLLGMVDAAIGGKTGIDHARGKNLIGAFAQPRAVVCDPATLDTLPERQLRAGWGEVVKHGFILDRDLIAILEQHAGDLNAMKDATLIARGGCNIKAAVVSEDEKESDRRSLLNYGHTVGHAIEAVQNYEGLLHGEAICVGMRAAGIISVELGLLAPDDFDRQQALIIACGLPDSVSGITVDAIIDATKSDKKSSGGVIKWVVLSGLGNATLCAEVPDSLVRKAVATVIV